MRIITPIPAKTEGPTNVHNSDKLTEIMIEFQVYSASVYLSIAMELTTACEDKETVLAISAHLSPNHPLVSTHHINK